MPEAIAPLHLVTDDRVVTAPDFLARAAVVLETAGTRAVLHLRAPHASGATLYHLAEELLPRARQSGALLLLNDRVDVALAVGVDGVHLGARSLDAADARRLIGAGCRLGISVHEPADAAAALAGAPDFLMVGTLYPSASHPGRAGAGPERLADFGGFGAPLVAIGGITPERIAEVRRSGAAAVAVLGGVWNAPDVARAARLYLDVWEECDG